MSTTFFQTPQLRPASEAQRNIVKRTSGHRHGPVTRVFSPGDLGHALKPFVFLDHFDFQASGGSMFPMHPHSGIATTTVLLSGALRYEDTTGASGVLEAGSIEWMRAGRGVWHDGAPNAPGRFRGYQLWVALPAALEHAPAQSQYLGPETVPATGPARLILGQHAGIQSKANAPEGLLVLHVRLSDGEAWQLTPASGHEVGWLHVSQGALHVAGQRLQNELAVLNESEGAIQVVAEGTTEFIVATAIKHPHPLVLGHYSVHTSPAALQRGEQEIARLGEQLRARGRLR